MSSEYTKNQLNYRRSLGVSRAWARERELVRRGRGTRQWSVKEQKELLKTGRVKGYHGHHMKSVAKHPEYADNPRNVQFLDSRRGSNEHLKAHRNNYRNESNGRYSVRTGQIRPMKEGSPRAMYSYALQEKAVEKRGYTKYAAETGKTNGPAPRAKGRAAGSTTFQGKTYERAFVKPSGSTRSARYGEKCASAAARQAKGLGNYGQKTSAPGAERGRGASADGASQGIGASRGAGGSHGSGGGAGGSHGSGGRAGGSHGSGGGAGGSHGSGGGGQGRGGGAGR